MAVKFNFKTGGCSSQNSCVSKFGCPPDICPDFIIRRHDTKPAFVVKVDECDGPFNVQGLVVEVNMWAKGRLKAAITTESTYFGLADGIGFEQIMIGDVIVMDRTRAPEYMLVTGFDEENMLVQVERGYRSTTVSNWKKGASLRIFRIMNGQGQAEIILEDIQSVDGTVEKDVLTASFLSYEWTPEDTCLPGCYWIEFKVLKMKELTLFLPGGHWTGEVHQDETGSYFTGTDELDSEVPLSYDSVNDLYLIPSAHWTGEAHLYSGQYFTGTEHTDGSVYLNNTDVPSGTDIGYNSIGEDTTTLSALAASITPSFTPSFTPSEIANDDWQSYFGCFLGEGVEWQRKFPLHAEGFLVKIMDSPTKEL